MPTSRGLRRCRPGSAAQIPGPAGHTSRTPARRTQPPASCGIVSTLTTTLVACGLVAANLAGGARAQHFDETVLVERVVLEARVVDRAGRPLVGLGRDDFLLRVDGVPVPLESAEWIPEAPPPAWAVAGATDLPPPRPQPRLVVLFVQADLHPSRLAGLMRMWPKVVGFLATLKGEDLVALLSFDAHLKLHHDFTTDRERTRTAILPTRIFREPPLLAPHEAPSLAAHLDPTAARRAATPERALALTARALEAIGGVKTLVYLGWGLGRFSTSGVHLPRDYFDAVAALTRSRTTVMTLDVTDADYHSLEVGLERVARDTGGFYAKTHLFPDVAMANLAGAMTGYYELVFEKPELPRGTHRITIRLAHQRGTVFSRTAYAD